MPRCIFFSFVVLMLSYALGCASKSQAEKDQDSEPEQKFVAFPLRFLSAVDEAKRLAALRSNEPELSISVDEETNTLFLQASAETTRKAKGFLDRNDQRKTHYTIELKRTSAAKMATMLKSAVALQTFFGDDRIVDIEAEPQSNSIYVRCCSKKYADIEQLIASFGEPMPLSGHWCCGNIGGFSLSAASNYGDGH